MTSPAAYLTIIIDQVCPVPDRHENHSQLLKEWPPHSRAILIRSIPVKVSKTSRVRGHYFGIVI